MIRRTTRYCPSAAGRIEFLSFGPVTGLQRLNLRVPKKRESATPAGINLDLHPKRRNSTVGSCLLV